MCGSNSLPLDGTSAWDKQVSQDFILFDQYFVPERARQIEAVLALISHNAQPGWIIDLGCREWLLSQSILENIAAANVAGLDGSPATLKRAQARLAGFGERFLAQQFDLFERNWPELLGPVRALVSSLAIHNLDGSQKQALFRDVFDLLAPGGWFVIADIVEPANQAGWKLAADAWDEAIREQSLELDGTLEGFSASRRFSGILSVISIQRTSTAPQPSLISSNGSNKPASTRWM